MSEDDRPPLADLIAKNLKQIQQAFAEKSIKISRQAVDQWRDRGVPPDRAVTVSEVLGLHPHDICPSVFPPPTTTSTSKPKS